MNQNSSAILSLIVGAIIIILVSWATYFIGGKMSIYILDAAQRAGEQVPEHQVWVKNYFYLVRYMGIAVGMVLMLWTALTHWGLRSENPNNQGKLWLWLLFGCLIAVMCVVSPIIFSYVYPDYSLIVDYRIYLLFFVAYDIVGYWGGSIIVTSDKYKYTPLLSRFFR